MHVGIPASVRVSLVALAVYVLAVWVIQVAWHGAAVTRLLPSLILPGLIAYGIVRRHRLAWQWGRLVGLGVALLQVFLSVLTIARFGAPAKALPLLGLSAPLLAIGVALGRPSAREWFGMACPVCGAQRSRPVDLFYNRARCKACQYVW